MNATHRLFPISFRLPVLLLMMAGLASCSHAPRRPGPEASPDGAAPRSSLPQAPAEPAGPPEPYGPQPAPPAEVYGPTQIQLRPVVLVLGPGMARGFAHAGVLRALEDAKVPVAGIVGTEMGALLGTLYAASRNGNEFEFGLLRLKEDLFNGQGVLLSRLFRAESEGRGLEETLEKLLGSKDLKELRLPSRVLVQRIPGAASLLESGRAAQAVRAALAIPGVLRAGKLGTGTAGSSGEKYAYPVSEARSAFPGSPVVVVDVADPRAASARTQGQREEVRRYLAGIARQSQGLDTQADLVIRPELKGIEALDYSKKTEVIFRGRSATQARLGQIRHLVGMPGENP